MKLHKQWCEYWGALGRQLSRFKTIIIIIIIIGVVAQCDFSSVTHAHARDVLTLDKFEQVYGQNSFSVWLRMTGSCASSVHVWRSSTYVSGRTRAFHTKTLCLKTSEQEKDFVETNVPVFTFRKYIMGVSAFWEQVVMVALWGYVITWS